MASSETLHCILSSSEKENAVSIAENSDLRKSAKKKKLMGSPKKTNLHKKQYLKVLLLTNPCIKESWKILIQLQKLMATGMLFTVFRASQTLHAIIWVSEIKKQQHCRTLYHKTMEKLVKNIPKKDSFFTSTASD